MPYLNPTVAPLSALNDSRDDDHPRAHLRGVLSTAPHDASDRLGSLIHDRGLGPPWILAGLRNFASVGEHDPSDHRRGHPLCCYPGLPRLPLSARAREHRCSSQCAAFLPTLRGLRRPDKSNQPETCPEMGATQLALTERTQPSFELESKRRRYSVWNP